MVISLVSLFSASSAFAEPVLRFVNGNEVSSQRGSQNLPQLPSGQIQGDKKVGERYSQWRQLSSVTDGERYNCSNMTPRAEDIEQGVSFTQSGQCSVDVASERDVYFVYESGNDLLAKKEVQNVAQQVSHTQQAVGERYQVSREYVGQTSRISTFCVSFSNPERHYKSHRSYYNVYDIVYSNGEKEQESDYSHGVSRTFWTDDRSVCVSGTQGL